MISIKSDRISQGMMLGLGLDSIVYEAFIKSLPEETESGLCALKKYNQESEPFFENEKQIHLSLNHPNIVKLLYYVEKPESPYNGLVLEIAIHGTFWKYLHRPNINQNVCISVLIGLFSALEYLHAQKVIHADIKPSNILLVEGSEGIVGKLSDFGFSMKLCKKASDQHYHYTTAVDIWAAGMLIEEASIMGDKKHSFQMSLELNSYILKCKKTKPNERANAEEGKKTMSLPGIKLW